MDTASDVDVQAKKKAEEVVKWNEYEALRDTMYKKISAEVEQSDDSLRKELKSLYKKISAEVEKSDDSLREELNTLDLKIEAAATQESVNILQEAVTNLTRQIANLTTLVHRAPPNANNAADLDGRGNMQGGRGGFAAWRIPLENNREDDGLGKPKFSIPVLTGDTEDVEEYLMWELKIEKLWRLHDYSEERKIKLASSGLEGYALLWWDGITILREEHEEPEVDTWGEMKQLLRDRFVPKNYIRTLYDKL